MRLINIVLKSITKRLLKVIFVFMGITIGVSTIVAVYNVTESMKLNMTDQTNYSGPDLIITPDSKGVTLEYGGIILPEIIYDTQQLTVEDLDEITKLTSKHSLNAISPKITGVVNDDTGKSYVINGIDASEEFKINPWLIENADSKSDTTALLEGNNIIIGDKVAKQQNVNEGGEIVLNEQNFTVAYVLDQIGGPEDLRIYMSLANAGDVLNQTNTFSSVEISINKNLTSETVIINEINKEITHVKVLSPRRDAVLKNDMLIRFTRFGFALSALVFIAGTLMVSITVMGSVKEKTKEIGIFRALGFRKAQIAKMILLESGLISFFAGISGYFFGYMISQIASKYFTYISSIQSLNFVIFCVVVLLSIVSGVISSIYPAIKGANLNPVEAMRFI